MAPSPPEHATSAVDQAYDAFDESSITLQEMVEKKLSAGSINRQTHTSLDRSMGIVPYTSSLVDPTRHASKERLYWLRDFCKEGIKAKTFSAPAHSMSQLYKMLETYEAHRESLKSKKPQPAVGTKVGKKIIKSSATVETEPESGDDKSVSDEVSATAPANEMDVDQEASSTISLLPAAVITGPAESRAGSGAVPAGLHFSKSNTTEKLDKIICCTYCAGINHLDSNCILKNKARKIHDQEAKSKASKSGSSKEVDVIVIDEPVELPFAEVVRKVFADFSIRHNYTDDVGITLKKTAAEEKAEAQKRKKKMEPKFIITDADPSPSVVIETSRKRRRHRSAHVYDADQEYEVPSNPTSDVSSGTIKRARDLVESEDFAVTSERMHQDRHKELKRQAFICGYRIKHFMSLRKFYLEEIAANKAELDDFHDEMDAE
ncbi:hypothetical protein B0H13DRAFT_2386047 [Mycena leptocephala]|nr:hypothetical protein B0H13DRAFT_2386047 [Mycena leptocephala]